VTELGEATVVEGIVSLLMLGIVTVEGPAADELPPPEPSPGVDTGTTDDIEPKKVLADVIPPVGSWSIVLSDELAAIPEDVEESLNVGTVMREIVVPSTTIASSR
jgi:hypothetical protein